MAEFRMPSLGADMTSGVLLEWLVRPGTVVHKGDIVAVVDTDKAAIEVECFDSGTVGKLLVEPGTRVPVGTALATIDTTGAAVTVETAPPTGVAPVPPAAPTTVHLVPTRLPSPVMSPMVRREAADRHVDLHAVHGTGPGGRITRGDVQHAAERPARRRISPRARRLAATAGIDLTTLEGTGHLGAVRGTDIQRLTEQPPTPPSGAEAPTSEAAQHAATMRTVIAALMARSKREIPHYYLTETIDLTDTLAWLRDTNRALPVPRRIVPAAVLLKAAALAARDVPELNGFWQHDHFTPATAVHLGVAISLRGGGLIAPAIPDATNLDLPALMAHLKDLVARTRAGRLRGSELSSPTITVSNLGEQGVESIIGVIYPPQVALVGFGTIADRPWAVHGLLGVRSLVTASLAADHRASDGATGARYLRALHRLLQTPEEL